MNPTYNVLNEPWIPVINSRGEIGNIGIRKVLASAHELIDISISSPIQEYSIYRFLGVFLMDALRPESELDIEDLLAENHFEMSRIEHYINECENEGVSFDLFDTVRPFLQSVFDPASNPEQKPVSILDCTRASGNNHTHFDHIKAHEEGLTPDIVLKQLLATYLFCTAGAQGYPSGVYGAPPYFSVIKGKNLFETLVFLLIPIDTIGISFDNPPVFWRRKESVIPKKEIGMTSWLMGMLFPTRKIQLIPEESGNVKKIFLCQGENFVNKESWKDPFVTYHRHEERMVSIKPTGEFAVWRNLCDIVNVPGKCAPQTLSQYKSICLKDTVVMTLYGVETNQASYLSMYRHDLSFPIRLTENEESIQLLYICISTSENLNYSLKKSLKAIKILDDSTISLASQRFYSRCEKHFWKTCNMISSNKEQNDLYTSFCSDISTDVMDIYTEILASMNIRSRDLAATEKQRNELQKSIRKLRKETSV